MRGRLLEGQVGVAVDGGGGGVTGLVAADAGADDSGLVAALEHGQGRGAGTVGGRAAAVGAVEARSVARVEGELGVVVAGNGYWGVGDRVTEAVLDGQGQRRGGELEVMHEIGVGDVVVNRAAGVAERDVSQWCRGSAVEAAEE